MLARQQGKEALELPVQPELHLAFRKQRRRDLRAEEEVEQLAGQAASSTAVVTAPACRASPR
jgi:hypothetical protein